MRYISTRGRAAPRGFRDILLEGLAPDGGLYMPEEYPQLNLGAMRERGYKYIDVASFVLTRYAPDIPFNRLADILEKTYWSDAFGGRNIAPLRVLEPGLSLLRLSNGPTLAFKDVPLQLLGNLMEYALGEKGEELNILGATSGDTGSAAAYALKSKQGLRLFMLSPYGRMSRFQQRQMYTLNEPNIFNLVVNGTFDDCQAVVKEVNADAEFKKRYKLGAVNSINWARIAAQVVYYVWAYLQATSSNSEHVSFAVPSGNFGNALSAHVARKMGLPIDKLLVCTNENDVLDEFFRSGVYRVRKGSDVKATSSPSMDIASASNFERYIFDLMGRNPHTVRNLWDKVKHGEAFNLSGYTEFTYERMLKVASRSATGSEVLETIRMVYEKLGVIIDPHTAVAVKGALEVRDLPNYKHSPFIVAETAQPAKFEDTIMEAIGIKPPVPQAYEHLAELPERTTCIDPNAAAVKEFIAAHV